MTTFYYHNWTSHEDKVLTEIMTNGERKKVLERFNDAAKELQRTAKSCQNRWYEIRTQASNKAV